MTTQKTSETDSLYIFNIQDERDDSFIVPPVLFTEEEALKVVELLCYIRLTTIGDVALLGVAK